MFFISIVLIDTKYKIPQNPQESYIKVKAVLKRNHENMFSSHDPLKQTCTESTEAWQSLIEPQFLLRQSAGSPGLTAQSSNCLLLTDQINTLRCEFF